jgi:CRISPR-associated protein Cmr6
MVNMSGGVMENANICLNRYGLPVIPGSAVKGCARRTALAALREWTETDIRPSGKENLLSPLCENFQEPHQLLTQICLVFGWVELDWKPKPSPKKPDFEWASGNNFQPVWKAAALALCAKLGVLPSGRQADSPWNDLPNYAGTIAFLEAVPNRDPGLELDVLTSHHPDYYNPEKVQVNIATDTENPVPVLFPAVKEQTGSDYFEFRLVPMRRATRDDLSFAKMALQVGLETFGLGGKTNAGYGSFDASEQFQKSARAAEIAEATRLKDLYEKERKEKEAKAKRDGEAEAEQRRREEKLKAARELEAALVGLTPEQAEDKKIELYSDQVFDQKVRNFVKKNGAPSEPEKQAIVRALRGPRRTYWEEFKKKATKGDLATVDAAIRSLSKSMNLGKMP